MGARRYFALLLPPLIAGCAGVVAVFAVSADRRAVSERLRLADLTLEKRFEAQIISMELRESRPLSPRAPAQIDTYFKLQSSDGQTISAHCLGRQSPLLLDQTVTVLAFENSQRHTLERCVEDFKRGQHWRGTVSAWFMSWLMLIWFGFIAAVVWNVRRIALIREKSWVTPQHQPRRSTYRRALLRNRGDQAIFGRK